MLIIIIVILIILFGIGTFIWYAFRYEIVNFKLTENKIYVKSKLSIKEETKPINENENNQKKISELKILHLSDFHLRNDFKGKKLRNFLKTLSLDSYDFIFITGDMVEKDMLHDELIEVLKSFKAKYGIFIVFGAHDYYNKKPTEFIKNMFKKRETYSRKNNIVSLRKKLESIGIKVLQNENVILKNTSFYDEIDIIGVDDPLINKMDLKKSFKGIPEYDENVKIIEFNETSKSEEGFRVQDLSYDKFLNSDENFKINNLSKLNGLNENDLNDVKNQKNKYLINTAAIKKTNEYKQTFILSKKSLHELNQDNKLRIALVHTPDSYALVNLALNNVDIIFSGHTHGGQVRIPIKGALIAGCNLKTKYAAGLFYFKKFVLQVSRGLGEGRFSKFRIHCDPEAIITYIIKN